MGYGELSIIELLRATVELGGSDLHICVGSPPLVRHDGALVPLDTGCVLDIGEANQLITGVLTEAQRMTLEENWELDFAIQVEELGRFRGNAHYSRGKLEAAFRHIPDKIPPLETLGHPPLVRRLCKLQQGLILVTGVTGSGKSTTLASMVNLINQRRQGVIVSIEDPIEFVFKNEKCLVKQRQVGSDTKSFDNALRHVLRQDPDIILISEMRDMETIRAAVTAAETGHLVLSTLHTIDAPKTIDRLVDVFPADQQSQIVAQLANCLEAIVSQRLLPRDDTRGRVMACEVLRMNNAMRACIRERKLAQMVGLIEIGKKEGMQTIDDSLLSLYQKGFISKEQVELNCRDFQRFDSVEPIPRAGSGLFPLRKRKVDSM